MHTPKERLHHRTGCRGCRHFYVTWEPKHPYGCRAMGFKSRRPPCLEVLRSTPGTECLHYDPTPCCRL